MKMPVIHDRMNDTSSISVPANFEAKRVERRRPMGRPASFRVPHHGYLRTAIAVSISLFCGGVAAAHVDNPTRLRHYIDQQVGGIEKLMVPEQDSSLPQPRLADGSLDPRFTITEARRYLGKQLYFDPVRTNNIRTQFGGALSTAQTASCGSCHLGEAASRSGTVSNFGVGGEGRGFTDAAGVFHPRRRSIPGLVDTIPTLTEIVENGEVVASGNADAVDSVARLVPTMIGFAFNNRMLLNGVIGEPGVPTNPDGLSAGDNITQATISVHRMFETQSAALQQIAVYRKLFQEAFPEDAAQAAIHNDLNLLINDFNVRRAMSAFLRTVVTRNTPFDRFLAGDNSAMTPNQRRGARLFFTPATNGAGGAGCVSCHSGPILNKQLGDEAGVLVEENFINVGIGDHPLQALNAQALNDPLRRDVGRMEVTGKPSDAFKFRTLSLRQLKDGRRFMHNGSLTSVKDVVQYFNAGIPQDAGAGAAGTLAPGFTHPRGPGSNRGLGLSESDVTSLSDFLENGLYDPGFVRFDPNSPTRTFQLNEQDLNYTEYRPDLAALGAVDGRVASGLPQSNNDALSRRDMGLEFLDVTEQVQVELIKSSVDRGRVQKDVYRITNTSQTIVDTHLLMIADGLTELENGDGVTSTGDAYRRIFLADGALVPGQSIVRTLRIKRSPRSAPAHYRLVLLSGQGNP